MRKTTGPSSEARPLSIADAGYRHPAGLVCAALLLALLTLAARIASIW